jgi:hypothetical protein
MAVASSEAESHKETGVAPTPVAIEVRGCRSDPDQLDVDVEVATDAGHVAEQAAVAVYRVGSWFA